MLDCVFSRFSNVVLLFYLELNKSLLYACYIDIIPLNYGTHF